MGIRSILVATLGIAVAGGSAYMARDYIQASKAAAEAAAETAQKPEIVRSRRRRA